MQLEFLQHLRRWVANCCLTVMGLTVCCMQGAICSAVKGWAKLAKKADTMASQPGKPGHASGHNSRTQHSHARAVSWCRLGHGSLSLWVALSKDAKLSKKLLTGKIQRVRLECQRVERRV